MGVICTELKHQSFKEEREVRIIMSPVDRRWVAYVLRVYANSLPSDVRRLSYKEIREREIRGEQRRYIVLFEGIARSLPIKRIIVGPSAHQTSNLEEVRTLCPTVPITRSATPYIE
jgi:hypothetical protein